MQRDDPRDRAWGGREEDFELWGREMDYDDWVRGSYGPSGLPRRGSDTYAARPRRPAWDRGFQDEPGPRQAWPTPGAEPWRGDRDWSQEWWHQNRPRGFGSGGGTRHWHGRTPARGYRRSDERIREDVYERLMEHPGIDTTHLEVSVAQGEVTLEGTVDDRREKRLAEDLAEDVLGVTEVHNRLRTAPPAEWPANPSTHVADGSPAHTTQGTSGA